MINQANADVSFQSEKKKADSEWDTYSALEVFSMKLGDFAVACLLLSIIWHTSWWSIGLFWLVYILRFRIGLPFQLATRLVNTETFERDYEGQTPATMDGAVYLIERDWANLGQFKGQALSPEKIYLITRSPRLIAIPKGQALLQDRVKARHQALLGIAWGIIAMALMIVGILLSSPELLAAQGFVLVLVVANLLFKTARAKLTILSLVWGFAQLVQLAIGGFALYLILDRINQLLLFPKLLVITTVAFVAYVILESVTAAFRRTMFFQDRTMDVRVIISVFSYKYFPPLLFWILWAFVPQF